MIFYRLLLTLAGPAVALFLLSRLWRGETWADLVQRLGRGKGVSGAIWIHGASNGELQSGKVLIERLRAARPDVSIVVTCNTLSARKMVNDWAFGGVSARLAPIDYRFALSAFRKSWTPRALVILENEIWPNRIVTEAAPMFCVAARMSERSAKKWGHFVKLARRVLGHFVQLSPQDVNSGERFVALGLPPESLGSPINLKALVSLPPPDALELDQFQKRFDRPATVLAASTHEGEEQVVIEAFHIVRKTLPDARLIIAPRHPRRALEVRQLIEGAGFSVAQRSRNEQEKSDVYLADTLGEMSLWFSLAGTVFVGGSLGDRGGHTPYEPVQHRCFVLHGPDVANFREPYAILDSSGVGQQVRTAADMATQIIEFSSKTSDPTTEKLFSDVQFTLGGDGKSLEDLVAQILKHLPIQGLGPHAP